MVNIQALRSFKEKRVLVAGGTGLIGRPLVDILIQNGASVRIASMDDPSRANPQAEFLRRDLRILDNCREACKDMDYVFNLLGVKGSPAVAASKPWKFFYNITIMNLQMKEAARLENVGGFLYTSSNGAYPPSERMFEDDMWKSSPSENDKFPGWAKRMGELAEEACAVDVEIQWKNVAIVRPANVYGPFDNFDAENAMVIPSLIKRALEASTTRKPLTVWGDGSSIRDFIFSADVAVGMLLAAEQSPGPFKPLNVGSGKGVSIRELVETISSLMPNPLTVEWDTTKPSGDKQRLLDTSRITALGFQPTRSLKEGLKETIEWYRANRSTTDNRYDVFKQTKP